MRKLVWAVAAFVLTAASALSARQETPPRSYSLGARLSSSVEILALAAADAEVLRAADALRAKPAPLRIAEPRRVLVTPETHGTWTETDDGGRLWQLRIHVPGATDLNFGFTRYRLPPGSTLHVWSEGSAYFEGPYTARDHRAHRELWTPLIPGDRGVVELSVPRDAGRPELELTHVGAGYRDAFGGLDTAPGDCNIDVVCREGNAWREPIQGAARYTIDGVTLCSGSLINDARGSRRPFFLSAYHCGVDESNDQTVVVYWNFQSARCGDLGGGSLADNQTGATYIDGAADLDGLLIELEDRPDDRFGVYYNGWDRSGAQPGGAVGIHHPQGDEKAISFDHDPLGRCAPELPDHWMAMWELGTTEPGSSGSPILDPDSRRIVGFLTGGDASCERPEGIDCYGPTSEFLSRRAVRRALGIGVDEPLAVNGLDSTCDCSAPGAIVGTNGDDELVGTSGDDILCGLEGDDTLKGKGGRDCLDGGPGRDNLKGAKGNDALHGGDGDDRCNGGKGQDSAGGCERNKKLP